MKVFNPDKELKKIQQGNKNKIILFVIALLVVSVISYSFALYQVRYSKRIIYTKVAPFNNKDIELAVYLDGSPSSDNDFPTKNSGYVYSYTECDNNSTAFFDNVGWNLYLKANSKDKCNVYFITNDSEPNPPELYKGLIPVTFGDNGKVYVANPTNNDWYNYDEKRWANAVLVNSTKYYDLTYEDIIKEEKYGTEISMNDILQMYVWIPRYKYQLFNANNSGVEEQEIKIEFENGASNTGTVSCEISDKGIEICENAVNGNWYTHPAFKFGNTELPGIWVGKFEPSGSATALTIKPNITSWRNTNIKAMFDASRNIEEQYANNFNLDKTQIDTHMIKNMEWAVMAYLTHSKYGRCDGGGNCEEVTINSNSNYKTGYANTSNTWETTDGQKASTTGNIYGIYDTSGGAWDYMMAVTMIDIAGSGIHYSNSGFVADTMPNKKYYELYEYNTVYTTHERGHLGDATRETLKTFGNDKGAWYNDYAIFPSVTYSWFERGGYYNDAAYAGTFAFAWYTGAAKDDASFRVVLTAQDGGE